MHRYRGGASSNMRAKLKQIGGVIIAFGIVAAVVWQLLASAVSLLFGN